MVVTTSNSIVLNIEKDNVKSCIVIFKDEDKEKVKDFLIDYYNQWDVKKEEIKEVSWEFVQDQGYGYEYCVDECLNKDLDEDRLYIMESVFYGREDDWFCSGRQPKFK